MLVNAVPQGQGAVGPRAGELAEGCLALGEFVGRVLGEPVHHVPQGKTTSSTVDGVVNRAALLENRAAQLAALEAPAGPVLTVGGDCGVELVPISVARFRYGIGLKVAWFDAHADLNTAAGSPSGAFHGMVLRSLFGEGDAEFAASPPLEPSNAVLFGTRVFDPEERDALDRGLVSQAPGSLRGAEYVYLHLDLDVLDPGEFSGMNYPESGGMSIVELVDAIGGLAGFEVIGAGITECVATGSELHVLEPVIRAIGALLKP
ncbi:MAG: arginase [Amycolatopsis sp.]|jgi:arginase|uniref:arginase family protein n=1 Tax=Amycolatopsis sp. TaxID=37632 RepID=UPI0026175AC8|nr:arginase family protein [Amycolatopsis sp.]MCU1686453.1 arginase [Amycolatopsis sp.]